MLWDFLRKRLLRTGQLKVQIRSLSKESFEDKDLKAFLGPFERDTTLKVLSSIFTIKYSESYSDYVNWIQVIPGIVNSVLIFCRGSDRTFSSKDFGTLAVMISAYDDKIEDSLGTLTGIYRSYIRVNRHCEYGHYVQGRLKIIFDRIKEDSDTSFADIVGVQLEDIFIPVWGTFSLGGKGEYLPLIGKNFFKNLKLSPTEMDNVLDVIETHLSTDYSSAKTKAYSSEKTVNVSSSIFEIKPFLKIGDEYLLIAPHFVMNDLVSICANLFISKYSSRLQNDASKVYGDAFERYIQNLLLQTMPDGELEPAYGNNPDAKGVDFVFIKKNQVPLLVEIHKAVIYRSLFEKFDINKYDEFLKARVIPKLRQSFNWLKSHKMQYKDVDLRGYLRSFRFVICLSASVPLLNFDEPLELLLKLANNEWEKVFGEPGNLTMFNIFILGCYDIELISTVARLKQRTFVSLLYEYRRYYINHGQLKK